MARRVLDAKRVDDVRYMVLVISVGMKAQLSATDVERKIEELAR